jgi:thymidylate kinase
MIIVLEGLEGVGKTTLAEACAKQLNTNYIKTPPKEYNSARSYVASALNKEASFYFYLSGLFMIQNE